MKINEQITSILKQFKIDVGDGMTYLLSLHFGYNCNFIPDEFKQKMNTTKIYEITDKSFTWNLPLFEGQENKFEWVKTEYVPLFSIVGKANHVREATARMKKLFKENPEIRKDDVLAATNTYIRNTQPKYVRLPHYFIEKGVGGDRTNDILDWIERVKEIDSVTEGRTSNSNSLF